MRLCDILPFSLVLIYGWWCAHHVSSKRRCLFCTCILLYIGVYLHIRLMVTMDKMLSSRILMLSMWLWYNANPLAFPVNGTTIKQRPTLSVCHCVLAFRTWSIWVQQQQSQENALIKMAMCDTVALVGSELWVMSTAYHSIFSHERWFYKGEDVETIHRHFSFLLIFSQTILKEMAGIYGMPSNALNIYFG